MPLSHKTISFDAQQAQSPCGRYSCRAMDRIPISSHTKALRGILPSLPVKDLLILSRRLCQPGGNRDKSRLPFSEPGEWSPYLPGSIAGLCSSKKGMNVLAARYPAKRKDGNRQDPLGKTVGSYQTYTPVSLDLDVRNFSR